MLCWPLDAIPPFLLAIPRRREIWTVSSYPRSEPETYHTVYSDRDMSWPICYVIFPKKIGQDLFWSRYIIYIIYGQKQSSDLADGGGEEVGRESNKASILVVGEGHASNQS